MRSRKKREINYKYKNALRIERCNNRNIFFLNKRKAAYLICIH